MEEWVAPQSKMTDYTILLELAIILLATKTFGLIMKKLGLPQVVGALLAGILIGPTLIGIVNPSQPLKVIAEIGVILIMFSAGLETNLKEMKASGGIAIVVALMGVILPLGGGFLIGALFNGGFHNLNTEKILTYVFVGVIMTATSVSITVETLRELGRLRSRAGLIILSAAIFDDIIGIIILSVIVGLKNPAVSASQTMINTVLFFVVSIAFGILLHKLFGYFEKKYPHRRRMPIFALVMCFIFAYGAEEFFGVADITGAYMAGIILSGLKETTYIETKIETHSYMLFAPVFFASIGINADFSGFSLSMIWFGISFLAVAIFTKFVGCYLASRAMKIDRYDASVIGVGMVARGEVCLIVMQKGILAGLIDSSYLTMGVILVILSSLLAPILLKIIYNMKQKKEEIAQKLVEEKILEN